MQPSSLDVELWANSRGAGSASFLCTESANMPRKERVILNGNIVPCAHRSA